MELFKSCFILESRDFYHSIINQTQKFDEEFMALRQGANELLQEYLTRLQSLTAHMAKVKDKNGKAIAKNEYTEQNGAGHSFTLMSTCCDELIFSFVCVLWTAKALRVLTKVDWLKIKGK